ncbi:uncharacterized protein LOC124277935 [Haliotis rubra]|uniref:uncharacterized protein LOC124277935 n=1 Tax=Haliotis rubra TaxID=36100 RepID=UPI001EE56E94|nr:uncharacterized protein LOC124277935 [Haliotis rubra]
MMRAAVLCLVVALVQAGTDTETDKCEDSHDIYPADDWANWAHKLHSLAECGKTIADDLDTLRGEIASGGDWDRTRERLDEIVEKTSKVIFHGRLLYGPLLTMPVRFRYTYCGELAKLSEEKGSEATVAERHTAILADADCFSFFVKGAFTLKWLDPKYDKSQHNRLFMVAVRYLVRLMHKGHEFHRVLSGLTGGTGGMVRKSTDTGDHTDAVSVDLKNNILERLIKALKSKP